jgi:hypothetical protein
MEAEALRRAVATLAAKQAQLHAEAQALKREEQDALLARLDAEANSLTAEQDAAAHALTAAAAKAAALSALSEAVGGSGGRYGPGIVQPPQVTPLGGDRMTRTSKPINAGEVLASVRGELLAMLRAEGWAV